MQNRLVLIAAAALFAAGAHAQSKPAAKASAPAPAAKPAPAAAAQPAKPALPEGVKQDAEKENEGKLAATGWLQLLDRRDWGTAWERSSGMFRKNVPLGTWMDNVPKVREPFGAFVSREPVSVIYKTTLPGHPDGDYVTVNFETKFANKPDVKETVLTVRESDGRWRITGYQAQ
jgi:nucleoid-associated protein YgaU